MSQPPDHAERWRAASESRANVVVTAGAGTGKTYLLVNRLLHLLLGRGIAPQQLVALTFTKKAAGEMRVRLTEALKDYSRGMGGGRQDIRLHYHLTEETLNERAGAALQDIDKAQIGTIHAFAGHLLRLYPLDAGVDPVFEIDTDSRDHFRRLWDSLWFDWLDAELVPGAPNESAWRRILAHCELEEVRALAFELSDFEMDLAGLNASLPREPLEETTKTARHLLNAHLAGDNVVHKQLALVIGYMEALLSENNQAFAASDFELTGKAIKGWETDYPEAKRLVRFARQLAQIDRELFETLRGLLVPFIETFRKRYLRSGWLTHNAMLVKARDLVREHAGVRERLKQDFRAYLVDEFQDTDPLQGELLLYLCEKPGESAGDRRKVRLEPGKLFIVGDPKQSIYRFRGADFQAFEEIVSHVAGQEGAPVRLSANFRSHSGVLHWVNHLFAQGLAYRAGLQPAYTPLEAQRLPDPQFSAQGVDLILVKGEDEYSAEEARAAEARVIAQWIDGAVGRDTLPDSGKVRKLTYSDVALIMRSLTSVSVYLDALREAGIPYIVEGEKYFFQTTEVLQLVNLLKALADPHDRLSIAGLLRSPLGGLTDRELYDLSQMSGLDYRAAPPKGAPRRPHLEALYRQWRELHRAAWEEPVVDVLARIFNETFLLELAGHAHHREQTLANLFKLRRLAEQAAAQGISFRELVRSLSEFIEEARVEGESPISDASVDAVRILSIHKSKGMEYPVVILPNMHREDNTMPSKDPVKVLKDWSKGWLGFQMIRSKVQSPVMPFLAAESKAHEEEEEKRILYVAMTRAEERLILTGNYHYGAKNSPLGRMAGWLQTSWEAAGKRSYGPARVTITLHENPKGRAAPKAAPGEQRKPIPEEKLAKLWKQRLAERDICLQTETVINPSKITLTRPSGAASPQMGEAPAHLLPSGEKAGMRASLTREQSQQLGTLLHRFLEDWNFSEEKCHMPRRLALVANSYFSSLGILDHPLPDPKGGCTVHSAPCTGLTRSTEHGARVTDLVREAQSILADFIGSDAYNEIAGSEILGREVPFIYRAPCPVHSAQDCTDHGSRCTEHAPLVRGTMDVVYKQPDGQVVIGDYKSDQTIGNYEKQGEVYKLAIYVAVGAEAVFKTIFLRGNK